MRGQRCEPKKRACKHCQTVYVGTRSYCSGRCESNWKYHNKTLSGQKSARLLEVVEEILSLNLKIEVCMPWERADMNKQVTKLQAEYEVLSREVNG